MELEHDFTVPVPADEAWRVLLDVERVAPCMPGATLDAVEGEEFRGRVKVKVGPIQVTYSGTARFAEKDEAKRRAVIEARGKEARGTGTATMTVTAQLQEQDGSTRVTTVTDLAITGRPAQFGRGVLAEVGGKIIGQFAECLAQQLGGGAAAAEATPAPAGAAPAPADTAVEPAPAEPALAEPGPPAELAPEVAAGAAAGAAAAAMTGAAGLTTTPTAPPPSVLEEVPPPRLTSTEPRPTPDTIDLFDTVGAPILKRLAPVLAALAALTVILVGWRRAHRRH
jgi:carbon monoxide dehydrogenase subunit G